jgi:hypothetical protein
VQKALDNWRSAIEARDVELDRAVERVYSQFAAIVVRREKEYDDALRRSKEAGDEMAD